MARTLRFLPAVVLAGLALIMVSAPHQAAAQQQRLDPPDHKLLEQIDRYQHQTWRWQAVMGVRRTPASGAATHDSSTTFKVWVRDLWHRRAVRARAHAVRVPHRSAWLCIHRYERDPSGGWATNTGNGYYGGLQMDVSFQRTYGNYLLRRKGTADHWLPIEQMWVAERAYRSGRGFNPWPRTARACGLL